MHHATIRIGALLVALAGLLVGCASDPEPAPRSFTEEELRARVEADGLDPWPHYGLARLHEERSEYDDAVREYGRAINLLPPRKATRPVLELGILHHRMNNHEPALRCYEEVLATVASNSETYATNDDFKYAAVGAKAILSERGGHDERLEELHDRFFSEMSGTKEQWEAGATWITPLTPPGVPSPEPGEGDPQ